MVELIATVTALKQRKMYSVVFPKKELRTASKRRPAIGSFLLMLCFGGLSQLWETTSAFANYEIRSFHEQQRCAARVLSDSQDIELLIGYSQSFGLQVILFSNLFEEHEGELMRGTIGFAGSVLIAGTFQLAGPAIALSFGKPELDAFQQGVTQGGTLRIEMKAPVSRTVHFEFASSGNLISELTECVDQF